MDDSYISDHHQSIKDSIKPSHNEKSALNDSENVSQNNADDKMDPENESEEFDPFAEIKMKT